MVCTAQAMQGSNEWTVRRTSSGFSGSHDRIADEGCLVGAGDTLFVAGRGVPGGGDDGLVIVDLAVLDHHPMGEAAARGFVEADALELAVGDLGGVGVGLVAVGRGWR